VYQRMARRLLKQEDYCCNLKHLKLHLFCVSSDLLGVTNSLSLALQTSTMDFGSCARIVEATFKTLENKRNDQYFDVIWDKAVALATTADIDVPSVASVNVGMPKSKRRGNIPQHLVNYFVTCTVG